MVSNVHARQLTVPLKGHDEHQGCIYIFWNNTVLVGNHLQMYLSLTAKVRVIYIALVTVQVLRGGFSGEKLRDAHCLLRDVNHTFWHQLGCSE